MAADISGLAYFMPIFGFLLVFVVVYALLAKTKILGDSKWANTFTSFVVAIFFASVTSVREYVQHVSVWFAVLIVALFFVLMIIGFSQKDMDKMMKPGLAWIFIVILIVIFLVAAINVFGNLFGPYLPGASGQGGDAFLMKARNFVFSDKFLGAVLLLGIAGVATWVLTKK